MNVPLQGGEVKPFSYEAGILNDLEASFSPERMSTYRTAVQGDRDKAFRLYTWNATISAAFYGPLQGLEVTLRNAMHRQLTQCYGPAWYDNLAAGLDNGCLDRVKRVKVGPNRPDPPRVVAGLSFGVWVSLLGTGARSANRKADYETTLWRPALRGAFPHRKPLTRKQAHSPLDNLRMLRNRIAHHEPIFKRRLADDYQRILDVTGWISPGARTWIEHHSRVLTLLANSPKDGPF